MDLHAIKAGQFRVLCSLAEGLNDARDFGRLKCARRHIFRYWTHQAHVAGRLDGAGCNWKFAIQKARGRDAAHMPDLCKDAPSCPVHRLGHHLPGFDFLRRPDPRHIRIANTLWRNRDALGDDQAGTGTLGIVFDHELRRNVVKRAAEASKRSHNNPIRQMDVADLDGVQQRNHGDESFLKSVLLLKMLYTDGQWVDSISERNANLAARMRFSVVFASAIELLTGNILCPLLLIPRRCVRRSSAWAALETGVVRCVLRFRSSSRTYQIGRAH